MAFDPFDDAPNDDQFGEDSKTDWPEHGEKNETMTVQNTTSEVQTVQENDGEISVTLKGGSGYDAPWVVVRNTDPSTVLATLKDDAMGEVIERAAKIGAHFGEKVIEYKPAKTPQVPQSAPQPSGDGRQCVHGEMTYREGVSKAGNAYKGYFCPVQDRSQQCKPQFLPK